MQPLSLLPHSTKVVVFEIAGQLHDQQAESCEEFTCFLLSELGVVLFSDYFRGEEADWKLLLHHTQRGTRSACDYFFFSQELIFFIFIFCEKRKRIFLKLNKQNKTEGLH